MDPILGHHSEVEETAQSPLLLPGLAAAAGSLTPSSLQGGGNGGEGASSGGEMGGQDGFEGGEDGGSGGINQSSRFPVKLYEIINSDNTGSICWNKDGNGFIVNHDSFEENYLRTNMFKTAKVTSFVRQLNLYGFRKAKKNNLSQEEWAMYTNAGTAFSRKLSQAKTQGRTTLLREYRHPHFMQGRPEMLSYVRRVSDASRLKAAEGSHASAGGKSSKSKSKASKRHAVEAVAPPPAASPYFMAAAPPTNFAPMGHSAPPPRFDVDNWFSSGHSGIGTGYGAIFGGSPTQPQHPVPMSGYNLVPAVPGFNSPPGTYPDLATLWNQMAMNPTSGGHPPGSQAAWYPVCQSEPPPGGPANYAHMSPGMGYPTEDPSPQNPYEQQPMPPELLPNEWSGITVKAEESPGASYQGYEDGGVPPPQRLPSFAEIQRPTSSLMTVSHHGSLASHQSPPGEIPTPSGSALMEPHDPHASSSSMGGMAPPPPLCDPGYIPPGTSYVCAQESTPPGPQEFPQHATSHYHYMQSPAAADQQDHAGHYATWEQSFMGAPLVERTLAHNSNIYTTL